MHVQDDLYSGNVNLGSLMRTNQEDPTAQIGAGPMGRVFHLNIVPLALATANIAALQAQTANTALTLTAGTGITASTAPDGSGRTVYVLDVERGVSLTSLGDLSGGTFTVSGFNRIGQPQTATVTGPNAGTVVTLKGFSSVLSVTPNTTSSTTVSVGTADLFTFPFMLKDVGYIISAKWAGVLAQNTGTATIGDTTSPATATTGDPRGTFAQSGAASNGSRRLVICYHLDGTQCGTGATFANLMGVTPA